MTNQIITADQCRAARAFLNWSQPELAERCGLTVNPILNFEKDGGAKPAARTMNRIVRAFLLAGIVFTVTGGIERQNNLISVLEGETAVFELMEDVYHSLKDTGGEVLIAGVNEPKKEDKSLTQSVKAHIKRLHDINVTERILTAEDNTNFIAPIHWHRYLPDSDLNTTPYQQYGDKLAFIEWEPAQKVLIIHNPRIARTFRTLFDALWKRASPVEGEGGAE